MAGDVSGEEAAWRDIIARLAAPAAGEQSPPPWPAREDLVPPVAPPGDPVMGPLSRPAPGWFPRIAGDTGPVPGQRVPPGSGGGGAGGELDRPGRRASPDTGPDADGLDTAELEAAAPAAEWPDAAVPDPALPGRAEPGPHGRVPRPARPGQGLAGRHERAAPAVGPRHRLAGSRPRIVRPAAPAPPPATDGDEHYIPPPPPPLPRLDPVAKGAWAALFGGPGYLLVAVLAGWEVPGWAAFVAVAAFVGGFATLVVRMGDQPRDSGPDGGAVV